MQRAEQRLQDRDEQRDGQALDQRADDLRGTARRTVGAARPQSGRVGGGGLT